MVEKTFDECYWFNYDSYQDISLYEVGSFRCPPSFGYGPIIRDTHILHYIFSGRGKLVYHNQEYKISANQIFVVPAGEVSYYEADVEDPWEYVWIRFHGPISNILLQKAGITPNTPIYSPHGNPENIERFLLHILRNYKKEYDAIGSVYGLFQELIDLSVLPAPQKDSRAPSVYVQQVLHYVDQKYAEPISIREIADYCGLNRSYLSRIFKTTIKKSPQEYLQEFRLHKAKQLLKESSLPIHDVAYSVGYNDPFTFSKNFKRLTGLSPTDYRNQSF